MVGVIVTSITVFCFALIFWAVKAKQRRYIKVDRYGTETIGTVIDKSATATPQGVSVFGITFEFEYNGQTFVKKITTHDKRTFISAKIGMMYVVKYLPNRPKTAIVFIDRPTGKRAEKQSDDNQQRKIFINRKRNRFLLTVGTIAALVFMFWLGMVNRETRANIESYGIEAVGTVIHKARGFGPNTTPYSISFEFEHDGETFIRRGVKVSRRDFDNATIGMTFKVKFLPDNPVRHSIIFIDRPVRKIQ